MATTAWELSQFIGIHTQPGKVANGYLSAEDMENLRIDGDGWLQLRSDRLGLGPLGYEITGVATIHKHAFVLRNTRVPEGVSVQYDRSIEPFRVTRTYEADLDPLFGTGTDMDEVTRLMVSFEGVVENILFIGYGDSDERAYLEDFDLDSGSEVLIEQGTESFRGIAVPRTHSSASTDMIFQMSVELLEGHEVFDFIDGVETSITFFTVADWHDEREDGDDSIRFGTGDPVVWEDRQEIAETPRLYVRAVDDFENEILIEGVNDLEGRISVVNFNTYVILTSEGADQGYIIDLREGENYKAVPLGLEAPAPEWLEAYSTNEVPSGTEKRLTNRFSNPALSENTFYHYVYTVVSLNDEEEPWYGMASNPAAYDLVKDFIEGEPYTIENNIIRLGDDSPRQLLYTGDSNVGRVVVSFLRPEPVTHVRIYRSNPIPNDTLESVELTDEEYRRLIESYFGNLQYRVVGQVDVSENELIAGDFTFYDGMSDADWAEGELLQIGNDRLPAEAKQIFEYNDRIFAPAGDRLVYSDVDFGNIVPWAFPPVNDVRVPGRVDFCGEINEVLLFGSRDGLWRLAGNTEYNFAVGQISNSGPIDGYAWSKITDALAFVGEGGLFVTDASSVIRVSEIVLDDFFQNTRVVRGAVAFFKDGDVLYSVALKDNEGNTEDYQFKREDGYWVRWNLPFMQSASIVEGNAATLVLVADGTGQLKRLDWNSTANAEEDVAWSWTSQLLDEPGPGYANRRKRYSQFQFTGEADNEMVLQVWKDNEVDPAVEKTFESRANLIPVRVPINRVARRLRFKLSGSGRVKVQGLRLEMMV